jgi:hypothetical protein
VQTLVQLLPGHQAWLTFHTISTMNESAFAALIIWAFSLGTVPLVAMHFIDKATAEQCKNHEWPKHADQIHRDWCIGNGYKI